MELKIDDRYIFEYIRQMGYAKRNTGRWTEEIIDTGEGFPTTIYTCPFCQKKGENTPFCAWCGAELGE